MQTACRCLALGLAVCLAAPAVLAVPPGLEGDAPPVPGLSSPATQPAERAAPVLTRREKLVKAQKLLQQAVALMQAGRYQDALAALDEVSRIVPKSGDIDYNRACALARLGRGKEALDMLGESIDEGFIDADHIPADADLESLHKDPKFNALVEKARKTPPYARFAYEGGADLPGVKTVENDPPNGLRYRIRMGPDASKDHPDRLLVWLHPSGGSMNRAVEALAGKLVAHHIALMVFTQKSFNGWSPQDVQRLAESLADASKVPGINPDAKPLALGFSAGGQVEIILYQQNPKLFGGMVVDAAYPLNVGAQPYRVYATPPADPAIKAEPILAIVGGDDPGARVWNSVADGWKKAGAPLKVVVVPGRKHEWLFDNDDRQEMLIDWLSDVAAGKLPAAAVVPATQPQ